MNPSARGWIKKLLRALDKAEALHSVSLASYYDALRDCGFIYGSNMFVANNHIDNPDLTEEERCKVNLLIAFLGAYNDTPAKEGFIDSVIKFYSEINQHKISIFDEILGGKIPSTTLERIIHKRIQIDNNVITKSFNYFITNALLFVDVLAYQQYLKAHHITEEYLKQLEATIETVVINVLDSKLHKTKYDHSLINLLESSLRYHDHKKMSYDEAIAVVDQPLEANYLLDVACMSTWTDQTIDKTEEHFLLKLGDDLKLNGQDIYASIRSVNHFYTAYKHSIAILSSKNVVKSFYDNSSKMVSKLISRNSKRLQKELQESKELMKLISQSAVRDLTESEQKKMQDQLLDIFKTIPSLAIFMLPGGALLLPFFIKFIPKLLPSAFDDNRIEGE